MNNQEIARLFRKIATAYTIKDEKKFRFQIIAYQRAAEAIESAVSEICDLQKEDKLNTIPGVGASMQQHLSELCKTGKVKHFETVLKDVSPAVFPLLNLTSFGPKKAYRLVTEFNLNNPTTVIEDVKKLAESGKIATLAGFGEKSQGEMLKSIAEYQASGTTNERMPLPFAVDLADQIMNYMSQCKATQKVYPLGSLRRRVSTIGDIDIAVATKDAKSVLDHFTAYPYKTRVLDKGEISASILGTNGRRIDIKTQEPETFGALLQHFTGSKEHNVHLREIALKKGMSLSEKGIKLLKTGKMKTFTSEEAFYKELDMQWIPPEMREDTGEIELAQKKSLPNLVELKDILGDFHIHSSFPMEQSHDTGQSSIDVMLKKASSLGYDYLAFSEHNPSVSKHGEDEAFHLIKKRNEYIDKIYSKNKSVRIIKMLETDILPSGGLAIDEKCLSILDATIVSIHSSFTMDRKTMTERILKGLSHPKAKIFAHPSGRLINIRKGYDVDWTRLFEFCAKHSKALEINAFPSRLDLVDTLVRQAKKYGIKFTIDTDSHQVDQMDLMRYGVDVARRGWLSKDDILNCMEYNKLIDWLRR